MIQQQTSTKLIEMQEHHKVVIIGGGISGLAAAQVFSKYQIDALILEARDRLGGRIHTIRSGSAHYDLGASWAHDTLVNPLFDVMRKEELSDGRSKYGFYYDDDDPLYFGEGDKGPKFFYLNKIDQVVKEFEKYIEISYFESIDKDDVDLKSIFEQYISKQGMLLTEVQVSYAAQLARHLELWHGIEWNCMSSKYGLVDNVGRNCFLRNGYDKFIKEIKTDLDSEKIRKSSVVTRIDRSANPIRVELEDGSVIYGDWVICTIPQILLQLPTGNRGVIEWKPELPKTMIDALDNMSWGKLGKVIFEFDSAWWKHHHTDRFMALANPDKELLNKWKSIVTNTSVDMSATNTSTHELPGAWDFPVLILNMYKIVGVPSLLCFTQGTLTEHLEQNPSKAWSYMKPIIGRLKQTDLDLKEDLPKVDDPLNTIVSQWTVDPFSRGSYAACKPHDDPTDLVIHLERGLHRVRFAGEHTILDGAGAVHGAWMSGRREANYILGKEGIIESKLQDW